jgi:undecaprenyl-diphosphatase
MHLILQTIRSVDLSIYRTLNGLAGNWALDRIASQEEANSLLKGGFFFAMYWYLWFRVGPDREKRRRDIIAILTGALLAVIVARTVAFIVPFRLRPMHDPALVHGVYSFPIAPNLENWSSFPSDTAAYFCALAFGLVYFLRRLAIPIVLYTAAWICLIRMYLGIHYASDIVAGIVIGIGTVWVSLRSNFLEALITRYVLAPMESMPERFYAVAFLISFEMSSVFEETRKMGKALLNAVRVSLHYQSTYSRPSTPIVEWGGTIALACVLIAIACLMPALRRILAGLRAPRPVWLTRRDEERGQAALRAPGRIRKNQLTSAAVVKNVNQSLS